MEDKTKRLYVLTFTAPVQVMVALTKVEAANPTQVLTELRSTDWQMEELPQILDSKPTSVFIERFYSHFPMPVGYSAQCHPWLAEDETLTVGKHLIEDSKTDQRAALRAEIARLQPKLDQV
jgi:hypothetical protein